jgi:hypothetical protein
MKKMSQMLLLFLILNPVMVHSQGLEGIIVEKYYINEGDQRIHELPENAVTYRIFVDLEPDYVLQTIYGAPYHPFILATSTYFNNHVHGNLMGDGIITTMLQEDISYGLDTYITMGAASNMHKGILLGEDNDGSILKGEYFRQADGLKKDSISEMVYFQLEPDIFNAKNGKLFASENFLLGVYGGVKGPTPENRILIAQLTTDGELVFEINIQIAKPGEDAIQFVARQPVGEGIYHEELKFGSIENLQ